jgi:hypothetical protein
MSKIVFAIWKDVSKEYFYTFIKMYPKTLDTRVVTIGEPPSIVYYEKLNKNKVVARVKLNEHDPRSSALNEYEVKF